MVFLPEISLAAYRGDELVRDLPARKLSIIALRRRFVRPGFHTYLLDHWSAIFVSTDELLT